MTAEEKLMVILDAFEKKFVYLSNATRGFACEGSYVSHERNWTEEWMDWIEKLVNNDQETIENESTQYLTDDEVLTVARNNAYGLKLSEFPNALQVYIRGFQDGQWWRKQKDKKPDTQTEAIIVQTNIEDSNKTLGNYNNENEHFNKVMDNPSYYANTQVTPLPYEPKYHIGDVFTKKGGRDFPAIKITKITLKPFEAEYTLESKYGTVFEFGEDALDTLYVHNTNCNSDTNIDESENLENRLRRFHEENCVCCGSQRCLGCYDEDWRSGCVLFNEQFKNLS